MGDINTATTVEALSLDDNVAIFHGILNPSTNNEVAPPGSLYLRTNGETWAKTGIPDSAWEIVNVGPSTQGSGHVSIFAARNNNSSNVYLRGPDGTPMNIVPFILPFNCTLVAMSLSTRNNETWTAELRSNLSLVTGATLSVISTVKAWDATYAGIDFVSGQELEIYCNGFGIGRPRVNVVFRRI